MLLNRFTNRKDTLNVQVRSIQIHNAIILLPLHVAALGTAETDDALFRELVK